MDYLKMGFDTSEVTIKDIFVAQHFILVTITNTYYYLELYNFLNYYQCRVLVSCTVSMV